MQRIFSHGAVLAGLVGISTLTALLLVEPSQGHTTSSNPQEQRLLPREEAGSLFPSLLAMRDNGTRRDEGEVEEKGITVDLGGGVNLELVRIPAGRFLMGSLKGEEDSLECERPQHWIEITQPFYLGKYEVTQEQYQQIMGSNPSWFTPQWAFKNTGWNMDTGRFPVDSMLWEDAVSFCQKLSRKDSRRRKFRLPTEAEWEYACRACTKTAYSLGDDSKKLGEYAWYSENSGEKTHKVGAKKPSPWGLYDMHGNVWEWCADWYTGDYYSSSPVQDPQGPERGKKRVVRGGCWCLKPSECRAAYRGKLRPDSPYEFVGFRVAYRPD